MPAGLATTESPVGMQVIGLRLVGAVLLRAAAAFKAAQPWAGWPGSAGASVADGGWAASFAPARLLQTG